MLHYQSPLRFALLALTCIWFGQTVRANEDLVPPGHLIIMADQSQSMYQAQFGDINYQREGILEALRDYHIRCNNIRITYVSWGKETSPPLVGYLTGRTPTALLASIDEESRYSLSDTKHLLAWQEAVRLVRADEQTAIVYLTNEAGEPIYGEVLHGGMLLKVAVLSEDALDYLRYEFLPQEESAVFAQSVEDIAAAIHTALQSVDTACYG
jgi:hypothetical protein